MARSFDAVTLLLAAGLGVVGALTLGPTLAPQPRVPVVTHAPLPPVQAGVNGEPPTYPSTASVTPLISGRLNINSATTEQLEALPKVGPALAQRIIDHRPYRTLADLDAVKGIGEATLRVLTPLIRFQ
ncbi:ComEA family DNA-binding protein [Deinococcus cavernae]|uniref:ComEA family DNA-binding protein n=1 Tax=Deinococcus cavernae TaxID=2320857 RepID=A0A418VAL6_9DEIO|nr:ComEA family DNA-binding protein [Deinococcus cavernae]RJF73140.1 ComEA family DNA-binding protein [Deinococcus cavernae]